MTESNRTWETNAAEFSLLDSGSGWPFAVLVACSVELGVGRGARTDLGGLTPTFDAKVSATAFADKANTTKDRVTRYLNAWQEAADAGLCADPSTLSPSDAPTTKYPDVEWKGFYDTSHLTREGRREAEQARLKLAAEQAEADKIKAALKAEADARKAARKAEQEQEKAVRKAVKDAEKRVKAEEKAKADAERKKFERDEKAKNANRVQIEIQKGIEKAEKDRLAKLKADIAEQEAIRAKVINDAKAKPASSAPEVLEANEEIDAAIKAAIQANKHAEAVISKNSATAELYRFESGLGMLVKSFSTLSAIHSKLHTLVSSK